MFKYFGQYFLFPLEVKTVIMEKVLVVGLGEVGRALFELLKDCGKFEVYGFDVDEEKMHAVRQTKLPSEVDVMHICIPCFSQEEFVDAVVNYVERFKPKLVIVNSTVFPGTTIEVYKRCSNIHVAHSPVRGMHKSLEHMKWELKRWRKYVGGAESEAAEAARQHFEKLGLKTKVLRSCIETELAKLFETTYRAWMITCFQEMHRVSRHFEADFDNIVDFLEDTHKVRLDRPIMFPGFISGHCIIPNVELLLKTYDSEFLRLILKSNAKRKEEICEEDVKKEVEKIKERVERLEKELSERYGELF
jgi:UDP-N-acetyl-D-mannosaminuronate dehydrogenase